MLDQTQPIAIFDARPGHLLTEFHSQIVTPDARFVGILDDDEGCYHLFYESNDTKIRYNKISIGESEIYTIMDVYDDETGRPASHIDRYSLETFERINGTVFPYISIGITADRNETVSVIFTSNGHRYLALFDSQFRRPLTTNYPHQIMPAVQFCGDDTMYKLLGPHMTASRKTKPDQSDWICSVSVGSILTFVVDGDFIYAQNTKFELIKYNTKKAAYVWRTPSKYIVKKLAVADGHLYGIIRGKVYRWVNAGDSIQRQQITHTEAKINSFAVSSQHMYCGSNLGLQVWYLNVGRDLRSHYQHLSLQQKRQVAFLIYVLTQYISMDLALDVARELAG